MNKVNNGSKNTFQPIQSLKGKNNFKRYFRIERDGSVKERVFLDVPDVSLREEIICKHYLSFLVRNFIEKPIGVNFITRDNPWDFTVELSSGLLFNVEITSVADNKWFYEKMKREEEFAKILGRKNITLGKLKQIYKWFGDKKAEKMIKEAEKKLMRDHKEIRNPFYNGGAKIYLSDSKEEKDSLDLLIFEAIKRKAAKKHQDKENTILIIDNRTSRFDIKDYQRALKKLEDQIEDIPFPEIYFYTGYYSDDDGSNAEYSFAPIKLPKEKYELIQKRIGSGKLNLDLSTGIAYD